MEEETSHIISKLHSCRRPFALTIDTEQCKRYLKTHFTGQVDPVSSSQIQPAMASNVDHERLVKSKEYYIPYFIFNARRMRTRVTVLTLCVFVCVCLFQVCCLQMEVIQQSGPISLFFVSFSRFSTHGFV